MKVELDLIEMGKRITKEREALKLTRDQLAYKVGVSGDTIKHVEYGEQSLTMAHFKALVVALDVSADYILGIDDKIMTDVEEDAQKRSSISNVNYIMEHFDADRCSKVEDLIRTLKEWNK